jgi:steroid 5-alpha reductase family enzyme
VQRANGALTEKDIATRRPEYQAYIWRTSAFVPLPPR